MSRLDNIDALEKQLADLQMTNKEFSNKGKKIPPVVPPKKKAQPQVPRSAVVSTLCGPSYSTKISPVLNNNAATQNQSLSNVHLTAADYANVSHSNVPGVSFSHNTPKAYNSTYSNLPPYRNNNDSLPPPPPPPPLNIPASKSYDNNQGHEEYLPPPSPVSSNYSELVRATTNLNYNQDRQNYPPIYQNEFSDYGASQGSTYEYAIYEPINPRPQSSLSGQNTFHNYRNNTPTPGKSPLPKEEEVDALTNMLVQSISDSQDLDVFGICVKCDGKVIGESSGCTAMGNMYHVQCFSCYRCNTNLQGKPFYAVEGHPFCETDYYETLEKCSVCTKPILDRILRATGKPYHPTCFTCVVCGKSLDGIPFTVDAMNQIHCIEDFHKKFAPRCCVCELPIMPEEGQEETVRVVALDRSFHVRCYRCEDCGLLLSSEAEGRGCYPLDDHILCKNCNAHRIRMLTVPVMTTDL
ncbi:lipoma-preferred partner homolog [Leguminivora glycinivorella]|uniref:lipoma-preferred partner homolog n=1 Tax=Leguminivora glycinivorella TaxID=1035111 RepID=UPI00200ECB5F|nr:lipoma-preferred partner homolog [Leguminivora glycinivorella]